MSLTRFSAALAALAVAAGLFGQQALADPPPAASSPKGPSTPATGKTRPAAKLDLTPASFPKLRALIRPHDDEWRHLKVNWLTDVVAARKKAAAEDKPIVICYTGGAGYNEPLGVC
jgi:hypothetical protein